MSLQSGLNIMDVYRNFVKEKEKKNEVELVIDGELLTERKHVPNPKPGIQSEENWSWKLTDFNDFRERIKDFR